MKIVHTVTNVTGGSKIDFFRRDDDTFGFEAQIWLVEEEAWAPYGRYSECRVGSLEEAISEAAGRVAWLQDEFS